MHLNLSLLALFIFLQGCASGSSDSFKILGFQKQEDRTLVNMELKLYSNDAPLFFGVDADENHVLTLQLDNGLEVDPDIEETAKLARSCAKVRYHGPIIEVVCQVAFKTKAKELPKNLVYRWNGPQKVQIEASFDD